MQAVGQSAGILGSLYGNVPVASAPQQIPLSAGSNDILSAGGISGGKSSDISTAIRGMRDAGVNNWNDLTAPQQNAWAGKYPVLQTKMTPVPGAAK